MTESTGQMSRRERYAEQTHQDILAAGRALFAERGFFATRVDDIAAAAGVAAVTVYSVVGSKRGLLVELLEQWTSHAIVDRAMTTIRAADVPVEVVRASAANSRELREEFADVIRVLLTTAPHDAEVAEHLAAATAAYRATFSAVADRLRQLDALREGLDVDTATDLLWFYFGYASYFTLHDDNGWSWERAERWLFAQACRELLPPRPGASLSA